MHSRTLICSEFEVAFLIYITQMVVGSILRSSSKFVLTEYPNLGLDSKIGFKFNLKFVT